MTDVVLETHDLTRQFGELVAVDPVELHVGAGQIFGLLGSNGAGKTTVIKMLTTLLPRSAGRATVAGFDNRRQAAQVGRVIGYVPQMLSADRNRFSMPSTGNRASWLARSASRPTRTSSR